MIEPYLEKKTGFDIYAMHFQTYIKSLTVNRFKTNDWKFLSRRSITWQQPDFKTHEQCHQNSKE